MTAKIARKPARKDSITIGQIIDLVKGIESQCRTVRLLLQRLDKKTEIKLTAELRKAAQPRVLKVIGLFDC